MISSIYNIITGFGIMSRTMEEPTQMIDEPSQATNKEEKKNKSQPQTKINQKVKTPSGTDKKKVTQEVLPVKKDNMQHKVTLKKHENNDGDDDESDDCDWEECSDSTDTDEPVLEEVEYVLDEAKYAKLLNQLFPSAYSKDKAERAQQNKKKAKSSENNDKSLNKKIETEQRPETDTYVAKTKHDVNKKDTSREIVTRSKSSKKRDKSKSTETTENTEQVHDVSKTKQTDKKRTHRTGTRNKKNQTKISKTVEHDDEETEDDEYDDNDEYDEDDDEYEYDEQELQDELIELLSDKGLQKFNIVFEFGGDEYDDRDDEDDTDDEDYADDEEPDENDSEKLEEKYFKNYTKDDYERELKLIEHFDKASSKLKENLTNSATLEYMNDKSKIIRKSIEKYRQKTEKKTRNENMKKFKKIISGNKRLNDKKYFETLELEEQTKFLAQMEEINSLTKFDKPQKFKLLDTDIPLHLKACAMKKMEMFKYMDTGMSEYYKLKNWIDTFMEIPFGKYKGLPVSIDDGVEACRDFMTRAKETLDSVAFGLDDAKMQIIQMIGTWITNPSAIGSAIAIQGPPGTGKTTLVKEGISKILGRDFAFIALGGATDSSYLEGHGYTYEGSKWGKIVDILVQSKSMNPIIYFDELDKISDTPRGDEIVGILTHLTDTTQNSNFHDKYFSEIDFDLSKCLFIFSYNDESKINPILKDRMYRIYTQGYNNRQKQIIAKDYLIPKIRETIKFKSDEIIVNDSIIDYINTNYVDEEKGVRNMKRCLEIIFMKLNLFRFIDSNSGFFDEQGTDTNDKYSSKNKDKIKIEFPITITTEIVDNLLKRNKLNDSIPHFYI